ncbi:hypothetical protein PTTG_07390 [Puccinia triticina 1-1 BBBD Race 1]|uniref:Zpr1 domain-containing protein n=1 Tax=Puccinia triticina (isolate 1-1 / race 1 (BBBD)) TaxID=630390 RepID=A0A180GPY6_PUCT1|nr:hypothetical protein PTTG_07390 [Puccinia triticina 1-1 BBBD Race 1]
MATLLCAGKHWSYCLLDEHPGLDVWGQRGSRASLLVALMKTTTTRGGGDGSTGLRTTGADMSEDEEEELADNLPDEPTLPRRKIEIPHFKEIILMSTNCASCGYKDNKVKSATAISPKGTKLVLRVTDKEDLARDILKSETAKLTIPEIDLHLNPGMLGGRFTTLEGLLVQVFKELDQKVFTTGDSVSLPVAQKPPSSAAAGILAAERPFTVILDDPISNSFIQNICAPDDDPAIEKIEYKRSFDQNEELGLNDMVTEN